MTDTHPNCDEERRAALELITVTLTPREVAQVWNLLTMRAADHRLPADYRDEMLTIAAKFRDAESASYLRRNPLPAE